MQTTLSRAGDCATLALAGEMTIYTAAECKSSVESAIAAHDVLEIDLAGVSELDTAGLQLLLAAKREAACSGKRLALARGGSAVREVFELCGLGDELEAAVPADRPAGAGAGR